MNTETKNDIRRKYTARITVAGEHHQIAGWTTYAGENFRRFLNLGLSWRTAVREPIIVLSTSLDR